jgi:hypothetical protein
MNALSELTYLQLLLDVAMLILIWLVQVIVYPSFKHIDSVLFKDWHRQYMRTMSFIVIPIMMGQLALHLINYAQGFSAYKLAGLIGLFIAWKVTFCMSVPCHRKLQREGNSRDIVERLVKTNWIRTVAWTAVFFCYL